MIHVTVLCENKIEMKTIKDRIEKAAQNPYRGNISEATIRTDHERNIVTFYFGPANDTPLQIDVKYSNLIFRFEQDKKRRINENSL